MLWLLQLLQEILGEIAGSSIVAWFKRMFGRSKVVEKEITQEYVAPSVTGEDLTTLYEVVHKIKERKDGIAEEVSKCGWEGYKPYFSEWEHYKQLVEARGEKEATLLELVLSLSNPLLEDRTNSDKELRKLSNRRNRLVGKIMNSRLSKAIDDLFKFQDGGQRNWIQGIVLDNMDSKVTSQIIKRRYDELVSNQLNRVIGILNELQRVISRQDEQRQ